MREIWDDRDGRDIRHTSMPSMQDVSCKFTDFGRFLPAVEPIVVEIFVPTVSLSIFFCFFIHFLFFLPAGFLLQR